MAIAILTGLISVEAGLIIGFMCGWLLAKKLSIIKYKRGGTLLPSKGVAQPASSPSSPSPPPTETAQSPPLGFFTTYGLPGVLKEEIDK